MSMSSSDSTSTDGTNPTAEDATQSGGSEPAAQSESAAESAAEGAEGSEDDGPADPKPGAAQRILDAAKQLFCERGYDGVSMRDVAILAGTRKASVFYHYDSKETLFESVLDDYHRAQMAALAAVLAGVASDQDRSGRALAHRLLDAYLEFIETHREWARLVQSILASNGEQVHLLERSITPLAHWTAAALKGVTADTGPMATRQWFVTFTSAIVNYFILAPALPSFFPSDPTAPDALAERRAHLHWLVDLIVDRLEQGVATPS